MRPDMDARELRLDRVCRFYEVDGFGVVVVTMVTDDVLHRLLDCEAAVASKVTDVVLECELARSLYPKDLGNHDKVDTDLLVGPTTHTVKHEILDPFKMSLAVA